MTFKITHQDNKARVGQLETAHGTIETPFFMPVLTKGTGKLISPDDYQIPETKAIICNALLLSLRPGTDILEKAGGIHQFINLNKIIFTDCGGFQMSRSIFELKSKRGLHFRNPYDQNKIILTPKKIMEIQLKIGSDVAMMLDDMSSHGASFEEAKKAMENTHRWGEESLKWHQELRKEYSNNNCKENNKINNNQNNENNDNNDNNNSRQLLFGIIQGNFFPELRKESALFLSKLEFDGFAIGGVAIGEPKEDMYLAVDSAIPHLPLEKPRYVMGVGSPEELLELISRGVDCFDSVYPTQTARHHTLFTKNGRINIDQSKYSNDFTPIENDCGCHTCKNFTKAYLNHLCRIKEPAGKRLRSIHNVYFILKLMEEAKNAIKENRFVEFKNNFMKNFSK
jgi:queuine tRNA-ribosyltransferase